MRWIRLGNIFEDVDREVFAAFLIVKLTKNSLSVSKINSAKQQIKRNPNLRDLSQKYGYIQIKDLERFEDGENCSINLYYNGECIRQSKQDTMQINIELFMPNDLR